jgi:hypothetical protein
MNATTRLVADQASPLMGTEALRQFTTQTHHLGLFQWHIANHYMYEILRRVMSKHHTIELMTTRSENVYAMHLRKPLTPSQMTPMQRHPAKARHLEFWL